MDLLERGMVMNFNDYASILMNDMNNLKMAMANRTLSDEGNLTNLSENFSYIDLNNISVIISDTSLNVYDVRCLTPLAISKSLYLFSNCQNMTNIIGLPNQLMYAPAMFRNCKKLTNIPNIEILPIFDENLFYENPLPVAGAPKAKSCEFMFAGCNSIQNLNGLSGFNHITSINNICNGCSSLRSFPALNLKNLETFDDAFYGCYQLYNVPDFDTPKLNGFSDAFHYCHNLKDAPNINTVSATRMNNIFADCKNLVNVPEYNTRNVRYMTQAFARCNNLSNASVINIVNMCINSNVTNTLFAKYRNLNTTNNRSPLYQTKFNSSYYSNRISDLTAAGWKY